MCVKCGLFEYQYRHDASPEIFTRTYDGGDGYDYEITYQKCNRCGEEVDINSV